MGYGKYTGAWVPAVKHLWSCHSHVPFVLHMCLAGIKYHYYNDEVPRVGKNAIHDYDHEFNRIRMLARAGIVRVMEPCVVGCEEESGIHFQQLFICTASQTSCMQSDACKSLALCTAKGVVVFPRDSMLPVPHRQPVFVPSRSAVASCQAWLLPHPQ